jgi:hypothetical protein
MRSLMCLACEDVRGLEGSDVRCTCGRSAATLEGEGWAYRGPSRIVVSLTVHEPEAGRMARRVIELADDERTYRARIDPLL